MSVTAVYGWSCAAVPFGAWIVTKGCAVSSGVSPPHHVTSPRPVARQYVNCNDAGEYPLQNGSSAPFHLSIAAPPASAVSDVTTCASSESDVDPAVARATVLRLTQVPSPCASAARFSALASLMSASVHGVVAGPIFNVVAPARATSVSASTPPGVVVPGSGPFARTSRNGSVGGAAEMEPAATATTSAARAARIRRCTTRYPLAHERAIAG